MGKDKGDDKTRENCGRYALYQESKLPHCYTLEAHYTRATFLSTLYGERKARLKPKSNYVKFKSEYDLEKFLAHKGVRKKRYDPTVLKISDFQEIGKSLCTAILDLEGLNPVSRLAGSPFKNINVSTF